ncbi:hypothetical protein DRQ50_06755, partial [bacterium]
NEKVLVGGLPACVTGCPTGALTWQELTDAELTQEVPGFARAGTDPGVRVVGVHAERRVPEQTAPPALPPWQRLRDRLSPHITLAHEWPLAVFTLLAAVLVGSLTASRWGGPLPDWRLFLGAGLAGLGLSASHLGQGTRAWRAPLHVGESWLSREVVLFGGFLALATLVLAEPLWPTATDLPAWVGKACVGWGMLMLWSIDRIYALAVIRGAGPLHSAQVLGTGVLLGAAWSGLELVVVTVGVVKVALFVGRQAIRARDGLACPLGLAMPRIGFLVAGAGWLWLDDTGASSLLAGGLILAAEAIDRGLYYVELEIPTPDSRQLDELGARPEAHGIHARDV